jgi:hypothetical protein
MTAAATSEASALKRRTIFENGQLEACQGPNRPFSSSLSRELVACTNTDVRPITTRAHVPERSHNIRG